MFQCIWYQKYDSSLRSLVSLISLEIEAYRRYCILKSLRQAQAIAVPQHLAWNPSRKVRIFYQKVDPFLFILKFVSINKNSARYRMPSKQTCARVEISQPDPTDPTNPTSGLKPDGFWPNVGFEIHNCLTRHYSLWIYFHFIVPT